MGRGACPHVGKLGLLISFVVLAIGACGGGAEPLSEEFGSLPPQQGFWYSWESLWHSSS
jgi:hypothetical protein